MTVRELYQWAAREKVLDAQIRICDGMAVSFYPELRDIRRGRYETVVDVSACTPIEFDELNGWAHTISRDNEAIDQCVVDVLQKRTNVRQG